MASKCKMTYYVKKIIGKDVHSFSFEGENLHEAIMNSKKLSFPDVYNCGICGSNELDLSAHVTEKEGHEYTYIRCKKCRATLNFGQQKKDDDVFYLRTIEITDQNGNKQKVPDWKRFETNHPQQ